MATFYTVKAPTTNSLFIAYCSARDGGKLEPIQVPIFEKLGSRGDTVQAQGNAHLLSEMPILTHQVPLSEGCVCLSS